MFYCCPKLTIIWQHCMNWFLADLQKFCATSQRVKNETAKNLKMCDFFMLVKHCKICLFTYFSLFFIFGGVTVHSSSMLFSMTATCQKLTLWSLVLHLRNFWISVWPKKQPRAYCRTNIAHSVFFLCCHHPPHVLFGYLPKTRNNTFLETRF